MILNAISLTLLIRLLPYRILKCCFPEMILP